MATMATSTSTKTRVPLRPRTATRIASKMIRELHPQQQAIYRKITTYMEAHDGQAPTRTEIASSLGIAAGGYLRHHLLKLEEHGLIVLIPGVRRGIRIPDPSAPKAAPAPDPDPYTFFISQWRGA
jgi:SOS-response transcriptional repressor LexA